MDFWDKVEKYVIDNPIGMKLLWSVIILIILWVISRTIKNILYKRIKDNKKYYQTKRNTSYTFGVISVICLLVIWLDSVGNLTTYLGLLSAGIAIALKEIFTNIAGWFFIEFRKPFEVGHRISIGAEKGDVIDKRLFQFSLMEVSSTADGEQSTGRIIDIPNGFIFIHPTVNYTKGFEYIWNEISVLFTFESNWRKAKTLLLEVVNRDTDIVTERASKQIKEASKKYMIHYNNLTPIVYTDIKESGVQLTIRYLCEPKKRRITSNHIWEEILDMLTEHEDIHLAYPTKRVINKS